MMNKMMNKKCGLGMLAGVLLVTGLIGCGGKQGAAGGSSENAMPAATPAEAVQRRLNDPNVSQQEKDMIRRNQPGAASATPATPASGG